MFLYELVSAEKGFIKAEILELVSQISLDVIPDEAKRRSGTQVAQIFNDYPVWFQNSPSLGPGSSPG